MKLYYTGFLKSCQGGCAIFCPVFAIFDEFFENFKVDGILVWVIAQLAAKWYNQGVGDQGSGNQVAMGRPPLPSDLLIS